MNTKINPLAGALSALFFVTLTLVLGAPCNANAKPIIFLRSNGQLNVNSIRCDLTVNSATSSEIEIQCGLRTKKGKTPKGTRKNIFLAPKRRAIIKSKSCFLEHTVVSSKRINVRCTNTPPTATPTATATTAPTATSTANAVALLSSNQLVLFNTDNPAAAQTPINITGVGAGDEIVSIDHRPQSGYLYGLAFNPTIGAAQLYAISSQSGVANSVGSPGSFVDAQGTAVPIGDGADTQFGIDFNPTVDRLRIVNSAGQNFRINPNSGAFVDGDAGVSGVNMDGAINGSGVTSIQETSYTNSSPNSSAATQYGLDAVTDSLYIQNPPNAGTQTNPVPLSENIIQVRGFDIPSSVVTTTSNSPVSSGSGFAFLERASNSQQVFCSIDLVSGALSNITEFPRVENSNLLGLAVRSQSGVPIIGIDSAGTTLYRFNSLSTGSPGSATITGINAGEGLVGIDFRPATGALFGLGVDSSSDTATLYRLDPQTGALTAIGTPGGITFVDGLGDPVDLPDSTAGYGFNFNPAVDRIRVVTGSGLNFRINPNNGAAVDGDLGGNESSVLGINTDGPINGATTSAHGTAYTNPFAQVSGSAITTQYTIDGASNALYIQTPPNSGTQGGQIPVILGGSSLDFENVLGFDIPSETRAASSNSSVTSGIAYAALTVGSSTSLYSINLVTGEAAVIGTLPAAMAGLAAGQSSVE